MVEVLFYYFRVEHMTKYYEFEVSLKDVEPKLWRRFQLPSTGTFEDLHDAIQDACGWENCHLYMFRNFGRDKKETVDCEVANDVMLESFFSNKRKCEYVYDFGDDWFHEVQCKTIALDESFKRRLVAGEGTFPPEDCGGVWGYERCLAILSGKMKDEDNLTKWLGDWNPTLFDLNETRILNK